ncbi:hypothetical protein AJ80_01350 [Polytolypa hystricis UAMH7299]|uniref:UNC-45/Cro1/She4 central domain-containing protein n=1 Tax=Polytolypa hystricis (strain UAMH7299) TaxID=1447883 RepID=A0A2B7YZ57_POLH7|nr:hypothetical protein AJ80_01350 [Polytolypa hystricis UAMH7299]
MVLYSNEDRAVQLAREAVELVDAGHREAASRNLREAISLAPDNAEIKSAFVKIREDEETNHPLVNLCRRYVSQRDQEAGREAARYLRSDGLEPPQDVALECVKQLLAAPAATLSETQDEIITGLVRQSADVRLYFAAQLQICVTQFFDEIYDRGDGAVVCLDMVVLDTGLWQSEKVRTHCESELFQLFIAKLMESGHDLDGRALKGIARLLAMHADTLQHLVDEDGFDVILSSLDLRLPIDVRSQATLATAKYLEASQDEGQQLFRNFVTKRIARQRNDDFVVAFSAAAAVFPIMPAMAASLFLTEGFLQSLIPLLDRRQRTNNVWRAVLELFNAACMDGACREAIAKYCSEWLSHILSNGTDEQSARAAVVLAKIRTSEGASASAENSRVVEEENTSTQDLVERFKGLMSQQSSDISFRHPIEGLAYSSVKGEIKEQLSKDPTFLKDLLAVLKSNVDDSSILYGGLMIIWNLTKYRPNLSEEQKKMSELKAYANVSKPAGGAAFDPHDDDEHVKTRCNAVLDADIMPLLSECGKTKLVSVSVQDLTSKILLALSRNPKSRGKLAQQGAVKLLLSIVASRSEGNREMNETVYTAAHALARVLISVNPAHVFPASGFPQITEPIRPLLRLLTPAGATSSSASSSTFTPDQPRDLLPVFESLLALTNLASSADPTASEAIIRLGWSTIEDLLLSNHNYIQRASCELVCNLMTCEKGVGKFADGSVRAGQRLHILLALADVEDLPTRRAAGGALAMLTEYDAAVAAVLDSSNRAVAILLSLCGEKSEDLVHRGVVCVRNLAYSRDEVGKRAVSELKNGGAVEVLTTCLTQSKNPAVLQSGVEVLKMLVATENGKK